MRTRALLKQEIHHKRVYARAKEGLRGVRCSHTEKEETLATCVAECKCSTQESRSPRTATRNGSRSRTLELPTETRFVLTGEP